MKLAYDNTYGGAEVTDIYCDNMIQLTRLTPCRCCRQLTEKSLRWRKVPGTRWDPFWLLNIPIKDVAKTINKFAASCPRTGGTLIVQTRGTIYHLKSGKVSTGSDVDLALQHTTRVVEETTNSRVPLGFPKNIRGLGPLT